MGEEKESPIQYENKVEDANIQPTSEQETIGNELTDRVTASGIKVHPAIGEIENVLKEVGEPSQIFEIQGGIIYGFVKDGEIYLDPTLVDANSPVHEYTHLWDAVIQKNNPELWNRGKELMKQLPIWQDVLNDKNYADIKDNEDLVASEVHSRLSGNESAKIFQTTIDRSMGAINKAIAHTLVENVKQWLNDARKNVKDTFTSWTKEETDKVSLDEFISMPLKDLLNRKSFEGVNIKSEEQTIIEEAKKNGTYLKAPNGKNSNLNECQWVQVRTRAFKEWSGDWEKSARIEKLRKAKPVEIKGDEYNGKYELERDSAKTWLK